MVDGIKLFDSTATIFDTNGLGGLPDAISCQVGEVLNGEFEMEMEYPVNGLRYSELLLRRIIFAKSEPDSTGQPFRIYAISKPINGIVTINAHHISYDLSGYPVKPFTAPDIQTALTRLKSYSAEPHPFTFTSDKNITSPINIKKPVSTRVALGGMEGSLLDTYRGEYEFDKFSRKLYTKRGADRGVSIRYGKNLTDIKQDENCSNVYTGVYPYWFFEEEGLVELPEKILMTPGTFDYVKILSLDFTEKFQEMPTQAELRTVAESYISSHNIGVPDVSIDVQFEPLMQSNEYSNFAILETVKLGDTVTVGFPEMGIQASAKCVKTIFNVITSKYETLSLGSVKSNLASTIAGQSQAISEKPSAQIIDVIKAAVFEKVSIEQLEALDVRITNLVVEEVQAANARIDNLKVGTAQILDGAITNVKIGDAEIEGAKIANATIGTANIELGAITNALIGTGAVDTVQIANGSITDAKIVELTANKITSGVLDTERLIIRDPLNPEKSLIFEINNISGALQAVQGDTLNAEIITNRSITTDKIVANAITTDEIAANAITTNKILANSITGDKINALEIDTLHLKGGAITTDKIASTVGGSLDLSSNIAITTKVSKTEYNAELGKVNQNYTDLKQEYDNLKITVQDGGGSNIIKNSVGYGGLNFWTVESGAIRQNQSTWILDGTSKHGWVMSSCTMYQSLDLSPNTEYTISGRLLKATNAGTVLIGLYDFETDELVNTVISKGAEVFDGRFRLQFNSLNTKQYNLRIKVLSASTVNPVEITDLMLARGQNYDIWSQANGETYTLNVRVDGKGVNVYSSDGMGQTVMSPEEFAGYYNNQKIFTLNGDITEVMGLYVGGKGLFIPPVKFVQTQNSLDIVWTGR